MVALQLPPDGRIEISRKEILRLSVKFINLLQGAKYYLHLKKVTNTCSMCNFNYDLSQTHKQVCWTETDRIARKGVALIEQAERLAEITDDTQTELRNEQT